ncbi:PKD repeat-containing protein [Candidatus Methanophagaceae archaeon]|nr:PKD repeat-containing protein [Methanophagales archaeon]
MRKMKSMKISLIVLVAIIAFFFLAVMSVSAEVTELWNRTYDSGGSDSAQGVATDASGNVIVTGDSNQFNGGIYYTIKYDPDGNVLWNRTYVGGGNNYAGINNYARGVATDTSGNVIVTGESLDGTHDNYYTIKYDPDGTELWSRTYDSGGSDRARGVATDTSGNVIVTGFSDRFNGWIYYTIKYDPDGTELWSRTYDSGGSDRARGVATDTSGNVIVTGFSDRFNGWIYYTIKYDPDGTELWSRTYDSGGSDRARGVATDTSGNVIVTGFSDRFNGWIYYTIKYDPDGTELWNRTYDSGYLYDVALGVATDTSGNVIVTGYISSPSNRSYYTIKYDPDGNVLWNRTYDSGYEDIALGVTTDVSGNVIVTGRSSGNYYTIKYDADGTELWNRIYDGGSDNYARGVATDTSGNVIVTGQSSNGTHWNYYTIKYGEKTGAPPKIISSAPESPVNDIERAIRTFNITVNQTVNVSWQINGTEVQTNESVTEVTYTNTSAAVGTWNVSAIVTNANGSDMLVWVWNVTLKENQPPVANFTYSPSNPIVAQSITFNASNSTDPDGNITKYEWTFGDGNITNTTESITTYSYASAGTFTVNLTVTDDDGAINTTTKEIVIPPVQDTTPPASITTLTSTSGHTWINWTWKNPADADFYYTYQKPM